MRKLLNGFSSQFQQSLYTVFITVTNSATSYTNGQCFGPMLTLTNVARAGISPVLSGITLCKTNGTTPFFDFLFFSEYPSNGIYGDTTNVITRTDFTNLSACVSMSDYTNYHNWTSNSMATFWSLPDAPITLRGTNTTRQMAIVFKGPSITETNTNSFMIQLDFLK